MTDAVIEVVSNRKGGEAGKKLIDYARIGIAYYAIYDPLDLIPDEALQVYELHAGRYIRKENNILDEIGLGLTLWDGEYEAKETIWLRWCDLDGIVLPTGAEAARQAQLQAEQERLRAERLAEQLRALGVDPEA